MTGWITRAGLSLLAALWLVTGAAGWPRAGTVGSTLHGIIALLAWFPIGAGIVWAGWRSVRPRPARPQSPAFRRFARHRAGQLGLFGVLLLAALTVLTPMVAPFDPTAIDVGAKNMAPCAEFWFGTDRFGRCLLSRLLYGGRVSLAIGLVAVTIAGTLGTTVGAVAGYVGGKVDHALMWATDLMLSMPQLVLLITIAGLFRVPGSAKIFMLVTILGLTGWMSVARLVRAEVLSLKERDFVTAARAIGLSDRDIVVRHILPNALPPVIVQASLAIGSTILAEAALSFLGLGVAPPTPTWGAMVNDARQFLRSAPWTAVFPGLAIVAAVMSFNLLGDGLRDALDPQLPT